MAHLSLEPDNLTALGAETFAILTGPTPRGLPGRSTATRPAGVFDGLTALRRLHLCGGALAICLVFGG